MDIVPFEVQFQVLKSRTNKLSHCSTATNLTLLHFNGTLVVDFLPND